MTPEFVQIGIQPMHRIGLLVFSVALLLLVLELVRRDLLKERYALLWLATSLFGVVLGIFPGIIIVIAKTFRFQILTLLWVVSFLFLLGLVLSFSVVISRLTERNRELTQELGLLESNVKRLKKNK